jgi:flavin-dependent dehydrogenase
VDPFCGEGIANALRGAEIALPFALEAAARGGLSPDLAARYERAWWLAFGPVTRRVRWLGRLFERPRLAGLAISILGGAGSGLLPRLLAATRTGGPETEPLSPAGSG